MKLNSYLVTAFVISVVCVIGFSLISLLVSDNKIIHFDSSVIAAIQGLESPSITSVMKFFTTIGSTPVVIVLSLFLLIFLYKVLHHRIELILFLAAIIGSVILNSLLKNLFHRMRPNLHRLIEITGYSFPSGHAMTAFTIYGIIAYLLWRHISSKGGRSLLILFSAFMILMIGISRIYLGVHYPSDIIGGYLASGFWLSTLIWFFQFYQDKRNKMRYKLAE
ncbi:phosphatase PAP2 family protein [Bacillus sp. EB600]|uniref:phosphatase PAP2 family protein n=1 Tax=Bacillus sp. EB600 TaxID=2806345 RepID=UPI0021099DDE|nr:phosphatase PAP2 family protein [Bacillus sp. EB600]MCQ6279384.1 phosphatase PAP2 family protein [Bacillus sp. EB600]